MRWKAHDPQKQLSICAIPLMLVLTACSVGMATSGQEDPELSAVQSGAKIHEVERELGRPISTKTLENGDTENLYRYELGNEPSAGRAVMHGTMDVLTLGLWELVGTPVEGSMGTEYEMTVTYGPDGEVKKFSAREIDPDAEIPLAVSQESRPESTESYIGTEQSAQWWKSYVVPSNRQFSNHLKEYTERHKLMLTDNIVANKAVIQSVEFVYTSEDIAIAKIAYAYGNIRWTQNTAYDTILFELRKLEFNHAAQIISHGERASERLHTLQAAK
jgi:hypothetical protein